MIRKCIVLPSKMPSFSLEMLMGLHKGYFSLLSSENNRHALCLCLFNDCFYVQVSEASASSQVLTSGVLGLLLCGSSLGNMNAICAVVLEIWRRARVVESSSSLARIWCLCLSTCGTHPPAVHGTSIREPARTGPMHSCSTFAQRRLHWCTLVHPWGSIFWFPFLKASICEPLPGCTHERTQFL